MIATAVHRQIPDEADLAAVRDLLQALLALQNDLHATLTDKLAAMKRADAPAIQVSAAREAALVEQFGLLELQRHALLGRLSVRWGRPAGTDLRMRDVIEMCAPPFAGGENNRVGKGALPAKDGAPPLAAQLEALAGSLRERMLAVADANRVVSLATQAMSEHFRIVFEAFAQAAGEPAGYSRDGRCESAAVGVLDAIG